MKEKENIYNIKHTLGNNLQTKVKTPPKYFKQT